MMDYQLISKGKVIENDHLNIVMKKLMEIVKENCIPEVSYNAKEDATEFRFEGYYCDFSVFLRIARP
jgi:hypothetical protein